MIQLFKISILFFAVLAIQPASAQTDTAYKLLRSWPADIVDLTVDNLDNIYLLSSTDQLKKYTATGDSVGVFNQVRKWGKLHSIDATNPLKLVLYYKDFGTVVLLDRLLSVRAAIDLRRLNILQTSAVALSYDNNLWLFDEYENKLKKISEDGKLLLETADFRMLFPASVVPHQILDQGGMLYLYDRARGVYLFDYYGTFKKKLPVTDWKSIAVSDTYLFGIGANNTFQFFNTATQLSSQRTLPPLLHNTYHYQVANNKVFAWTRDSLSIFSYPF